MGLSPRRDSDGNMLPQVKFSSLASVRRKSLLAILPEHVLPFYWTAQATTTFLMLGKRPAQYTESSETQGRTKTARALSGSKPHEVSQSAVQRCDLNWEPSSTRRYPSPAAKQQQPGAQKLGCPLLKSQSCGVSGSRAPSWALADLQDEEDSENSRVCCSKNTLFDQAAVRADSY